MKHNMRLRESCEQNFSGVPWDCQQKLVLHLGAVQIVVQQQQEVPCDRVNQSWKS